jgi:hypothetical protein
MTREELIRHTQRLLDACSGSSTDDEVDRLLAELESQLPAGNVSDLIFYSEPPLTAEQVVDEALKRKPIYLGP